MEDKIRKEIRMKIFDLSSVKRKGKRFPEDLVPYLMTNPSIAMDVVVSIFHENYPQETFDWEYDGSEWLAEFLANVLIYSKEKTVFPKLLKLWEIPLSKFRKHYGQYGVNGLADALRVCYNGDFELVRAFIRNDDIDIDNRKFVLESLARIAAKDEDLYKNMCDEIEWMMNLDVEDGLLAEGALKIVLYDFPLEKYREKMKDLFEKGYEDDEYDTFKDFEKSVFIDKYDEAFEAERRQNRKKWLDNSLINFIRQHNNKCFGKTYSQGKVGIIGIGHVGETIAHLLARDNFLNEVVLIDVDSQKASSQALDINHAKSLSDFTEGEQFTNVKAGSYEDLADADVVISTVGQIELVKNGGGRMAEVEKNIEVVKQVSKSLNEVNFQGKLIVITNPNDLITDLYYRHLNLPAKHVIGTGTVIDSMRMKYYLEALVGEDAKIGGYVIGEHGDTQVTPWSAITCLTELDFPKTRLISVNEWNADKGNDLEMLTQKIKKSGFDVYKGKGYTNIGIAEATLSILKPLIIDDPRTFSVSTYHEKDDCFYSLPVEIGVNGVEGLIDYHIIEEEQMLLQKSIQTIKEGQKILRELGGV